MGLTLVTPPPVEPITLQEAKDQSRIDTTVEDALVDALILTARKMVEKHTGRALITQTWDWTFDHWGREESAIGWLGWTGFASAAFQMPYAPLQSVTSIKYFDSNDVEQTVATTVYEVDTTSEPGRVRLAEGQIWPSHDVRLNAITIRFVAGYGDGVGDVPEPIKQAMLMLVAHLWCYREAVGSREAYKVPKGYDDLLAPYVIWKF